MMQVRNRGVFFLCILLAGYTYILLGLSVWLKLALPGRGIASCNSVPASLRAPWIPEYTLSQKGKLWVFSVANVMSFRLLWKQQLGKLVQRLPTPFPSLSLTSSNPSQLHS